VVTVTRMLPDPLLPMVLCSGCSCDGSGEEGGGSTRMLPDTLLPVVLCSGCSCDGSGEEGGKMCSLLRGTQHHWQQHTAGSAFLMMGVKAPETCCGNIDNTE
jgi:hypothetical protein